MCVCVETKNRHLRPRSIYPFSESEQMYVYVCWVRKTCEENETKDEDRREEMAATGERWDDTHNARVFFGPA